jgi:hypothetical protein
MCSQCRLRMGMGFIVWDMSRHVLSFHLLGLLPSILTHIPLYSSRCSFSALISRGPNPTSHVSIFLPPGFVSSADVKRPIQDMTPITAYASAPNLVPRTSVHLSAHLWPDPVDLFLHSVSLPPRPDSESLHAASPLAPSSSLLPSQLTRPSVQFIGLALLTRSLYLCWK